LTTGNERDLQVSTHDPIGTIATPARSSPIVLTIEGGVGEQTGQRDPLRLQQ